jgi:hypothetical protein
MLLNLKPNIHILGESRTGSTTLMYKLAELKGYNNTGYFNELRDGKNPTSGTINEPFKIDEFGIDLPSKEVILKLEKLLQTTKNLVVKDHLSNYSVYSKYYNRRNPHPRLYRNYTRIKLTRKNIWDRSLSTIIAVNKEIWVNSSSNPNPQSDTPLYINPTQYKHELNRDIQTNYLLQTYNPSAFHYTLDYNDLIKLNLTSNLTLKNKPPKDIICNIDELWEVFSNTAYRINSVDTLPYNIIDKELIPLV